MSVDLNPKILKFSKALIVLTSIIGLISIIVEYGFEVDDTLRPLLHIVQISVVVIFFLYFIFSFVIAKSKKEFLKTHKIESIIIYVVILELILYLFDYSIVEQIRNLFQIQKIGFLYILFAQIVFIISLIMGGLRYNARVLQLKIHPSRLFVLSFFITILIGTLLLMLPAATVSGQISFVDALFTSTSAVCVTGLITVDTATYFTRFGQIVIMLLFQIGGLGLMTFTTFFAVFLSGGLGIRERILLHDLLDEENINRITRVISFLTIGTFVIELIGSVFLFISIKDNYATFQDAAFNSIFHSISAFCNAGFSIFTMNLMDPLVQSNHLYTTTISILIILGGIGFPTIMGVMSVTKKLKSPLLSSKRLPLQASISLKMTIVLIIIGTALIYFTEVGNTLTGYNFFEKIYASYFQSVTARTAGFNTLDIGSFTTTTAILFLFLMFVGASPGGTGGGLKTTTFYILIKSTLAIIKDKQFVKVGDRNISRELIMKALLKAILSITFITLAIFLLSIFENFDLLDISFEAFSAFGTVGLSRGITGALSSIGKIVIVFLMFIGRVGPLAFIYSISRTKEVYELELPSENISIL